MFFGFCRKVRFPRHVQRWVLFVSVAGEVLGLLEPVYLHQPLSKRAEKRARGSARAGAGQGLFVITTNVDHCFQKAGFDKKHLFYTQGDYGLFQCSEPCCQETFDNEKTVRAMVEAQGFTVADGVLTPPTDGTPKMAVPSELLPGCPHCGRPMTMNLRCDDKFAEDEGWHAAAERYENFLRTRDGQKILFLELGVGYNTPVFRSLRTGNKRTKTLRKQRILGHLQILTTNYQERLYA